MGKIRYRGAGLPNIYLTNGYTEEEGSYGNTVAVDDVKGLHEAIGKDLVHNKEKLTGAEFRFLRKELGLSQKALGGVIGVSDQSVASWEKRGPAPAYADRILRVLFIEYYEGPVPFRDLVDRINALDRMIQEKRVFTETSKGWKPMAA